MIWRNHQRLLRQHQTLFLKMVPSSSDILPDVQQAQKIQSRLDALWEKLQTNVADLAVEPQASRSFSPSISSNDSPMLSLASLDSPLSSSDSIDKDDSRRKENALRREEQRRKEEQEWKEANERREEQRRKEEQERKEARERREEQWRKEEQDRKAEQDRRDEQRRKEEQERREEQDRREEQRRKTDELFQEKKSLLRQLRADIFEQTLDLHKSETHNAKSLRNLARLDTVLKSADLVKTTVVSTFMSEVERLLKSTHTIDWKVESQKNK